MSFVEHLRQQAELTPVSREPGFWQSLAFALKRLPAPALIAALKEVVLSSGLTCAQALDLSQFNIENR